MSRNGFYNWRSRSWSADSIFFLLLCLFSWPSAGFAASNSLYSHSEVRANQTPFSIYEIGRPRFPITSRNSSEWQRHFLDAALLRQYAFDFAVEEYTYLKFLPPNPSPAILADLETIKTGDCAILMITDYLNPKRVHQLAIVAYGKTLPVEVRLQGRVEGFQGLERDPVGVRNTRVVYREPSGTMLDFSPVSYLVSARPLIGGEVVEIQRLIHSHESKIDWIPVVHARLATNFTLFGASPIPREYQGYRPSEVEVERYISRNFLQLQEMVDPRGFRNFLDSIRDYALDEPTQRTLLVDRIYIEAVGEGHARMYANPNLYGFTRTPHTFEDPDFPGRRVHVMMVTREEFENKSAEILSRRPGFEIVANEEVTPSLSPGPSGRSFGCVDFFNQLGQNVGPFLNTRGATLPFRL